MYVGPNSEIKLCNKVSTVNSHWRNALASYLMRLQTTSDFLLSIEVYYYESGMQFCFKILSYTLIYETPLLTKCKFYLIIIKLFEQFAFIFYKVSSMLKSNYL